MSAFKDSWIVLCCSRKSFYHPESRRTWYPKNIYTSDGKKGIGWWVCHTTGTKTLIEACGTYHCIMTDFENQSLTFLSRHYPWCGKDWQESVYVCATSGSLVFPEENVHVTRDYVSLSQDKNLVLKGGIFGQGDPAKRKPPSFSMCGELVWYLGEKGISCRSTGKLLYCSCTSKTTLRLFCDCGCGNSNVPLWSNNMKWSYESKKKVWKGKCLSQDNKCVVEVDTPKAISAVRLSKKGKFLLQTIWVLSVCPLDFSARYEADICCSKNKRVGKPCFENEGPDSESSIFWAANIWAISKNGKLAISKFGDDPALQFADVPLEFCGRYKFQLNFEEGLKLILKATLVSKKCAKPEHKDLSCTSSGLSIYCSLCEENPKEMLLSCAHVLCSKCAPKLDPPICPFCRVEITSFKKIFL